MKKSYIFLIIILFAIGIGLGIYFYNTNHSDTANKRNTPSIPYNSTKVGTTTDVNNESANNSNDNQTPQDSNTESETPQNQDNSENQASEPPTTDTPPVPAPPPQETQIADFSTKIYTKDSERQNNISITCSTLNDTTVPNGETFSFCGTVGKATTSKGYEKADVYKDGEVVQALGGGNCQVSTTLYNAVLKVDGLKVTERHEHSNSVPYIAKGKDAAVAYGSYDFKFINNTGNTIKITASNDKNNVYIKIFKLS